MFTEKFIEPKEDDIISSTQLKQENEEQIVPLNPNLLDDNIEENGN